MSGSGFTEESFDLHSVQDAIRDFVQNWADQALGVQANNPISDWQDVVVMKGSTVEGIPKSVSLNKDRVQHFNNGDCGDITFQFGEASVDIVLKNVKTVVDMEKYKNYGVSTKRNNNNAVGYMGVGVVHATGRLLIKKYKVIVRNGDVRYTPHFGVTKKSPTKILKWSPQTAPIKVRDNFIVKLEGLPVDIVQKALEPVLWINPPSRDDLIYEDKQIGQLFKRSGTHGSKIYICHNFVTLHRFVRNANQFGINVFERKSGAWLTQDRKGIIGKHGRDILARLARLWNAATTSSDGYIARAAVTALWDALKEGNVLEVNLLADLRPACGALVERFKEVYEREEGVFPKQKDVGDGLYKALTSIMGTKDDYMRRKLISADDSDKLNSPELDRVRDILTTALPNMEMTLDDLHFKTTEEPDWPFWSNHQKSTAKWGKTSLADLLRVFYKKGLETRPAPPARVIGVEMVEMKEERGVGLAAPDPGVEHPIVNGNGVDGRVDVIGVPEPRVMAAEPWSDDMSDEEVITPEEAIYAAPQLLVPADVEDGGGEEVLVAYVKCGKLVHELWDRGILDGIGAGSRKRRRLS
ncbi:hypothetical protein HDV00_008646 [Rhizophlyctis rosea]|nr:hypothetical protein HDV00_008646 [Rhizophlyctis rosea]